MRFWLSVILLGILSGCASTSHLRYPPVSWMVDRDRKPIDPPKARTEYIYSDIVDYQFFYQAERATDLSLPVEKIVNARQEALNANNFDEVADSSWFTNRIGRRAMSLAELRRGSNREDSVPAGRTWTIIKAKTEGKTPGFLVEDEEGEKYLFKFDPAGYEELVTAAEMIGARLMHAAGYNVPESSLILFHPKDLKIAEKATDKDALGRTVPFDRERLEKIFRRIAEHGDGYYRALASHYVEGKPIGPFSLRGRRGDDPNDRIPHEHRRELRGYRVIASWIANNDTKEGNTLDSFIKTGPGEKGYVRHHIVDFGNTLGAASHVPKSKTHLDDYRFNAKKALASLLSLGVYQPHWEQVEDPNLESVGIFESKYFEPEKWRPIYPNPAFQNMTKRDAYWAAKIVMQFSDEQIKAIVEEGRYSDSAAAEYVAKTLIERRNKVGRYWFSRINPLDHFGLEMQNGAALLRFDDLMISTGLAPQGSAVYRHRLIQEKKAAELIGWSESGDMALSLPAGILEKMKPDKNYLLQIQTKRSGESYWGPIVDVVLKKSEGLKILGLTRRYQS